MQARVLVDGVASGPLLVLTEPLSFWGGFDAESGEIIDQRHPQCGVCLTGAVVVLPAGRGSSSASSVLAEAIRSATAPMALVMLAADEIVALGAIVADELYGIAMPVLVVDQPTSEAVSSATSVHISAGGNLEVE